jgi:hypothetical protein
VAERIELIFELSKIHKTPQHNMTPRSLFNIILKIFGLLFLREIANVIGEIFSAITVFFTMDNGAGGILTILFTFLVLAFYVFLVFQLLFKANLIIDKLKLADGFNEHEFSFDKQEKFSINISQALILRIALIVIGGVILAEEIPNFCRSMYFYLGENHNMRDYINSSSSNAILSAVKIVIGLLIIGERTRIIDFIEERQKRNVNEV